VFTVSADYATVEAVKRHLSSQFTEDGDDAFIAELIHEASDLFALRTERFFVPFTGTFTVTVEEKGLRELSVPDTLSLTSITDVDSTGTETALAADQYRLLPPSGYPKTAAYQIYGSWYYGLRETLAGVFGYHPSPDTMWQSKTTITEPIASTTATSVTVASSAGIETLDYIKVGSEVLQVASVDSATVLTVTRAALGTTAATHLDNAAVSLYRQYEPVRRAVILLAAHLYRTRGNPGGETASGPQGTYTITAREPELIERTINELRRAEVVIV
jgi:hypothetical protein